LKIQDRALSRFVDKVRDSIQTMQSTIKIPSFSIDYRRYTKFKMLTPHVYVNGNGDYVGHGVSEGYQLTKEDFEYCFNFVIDSTIRRQDFDFEVDNPNTSF
jgi:hypothetical protein